MGSRLHPSPPGWNQCISYPPLSPPGGFRSRHPARRRTSAFFSPRSRHIRGAEADGSEQQRLPDERRTRVIFASLPHTPCDDLPQSLLPCVSLQLFEETQEVCRNVPPPPTPSLHIPQNSEPGQDNRCGAVPEDEKPAWLHAQPCILKEMEGFSRSPSLYLTSFYSKEHFKK